MFYLSPSQHKQLMSAPVSLHLKAKNDVIGHMVVRYGLFPVNDYSYLCKQLKLLIPFLADSCQIVNDMETSHADPAYESPVVSPTAHAQSDADIDLEVISFSPPESFHLYCSVKIFYSSYSHTLTAC